MNDFAINLIREYECTMRDSWRNDFSDDGIAADEQRRENLIESLMSVLDMDYYSAENFLDENRGWSIR
jgi:hypothetical protein